MLLGRFLKACATPISSFYPRFIVLGSFLLRCEDSHAKTSKVLTCLCGTSSYFLEKEWWNFETLNADKSSLLLTTKCWTLWGSYISTGQANFLTVLIRNCPVRLVISTVATWPLVLRTFSSRPSAVLCRPHEHAYDGVFVFHGSQPVRHSSIFGKAVICNVTRIMTIETFKKNAKKRCKNIGLGPIGIGLASSDSILCEIITNTSHLVFENHPDFPQSSKKRRWQV